MGHTNSTANLALPQFIGTDKPTWLGDVNGAFGAIDSKVGTIDADISAVDAKADNAVSDAAAAVTTATNANNTAGTASTTATNALNIANNALTVANNADGHTNQLELKVGLLADLTTTNKDSIVDAINEVNGKTIQISVKAEDVAYNNSVSGLTATDVQAAVDELKSLIGGGGAGSVSVTSDGVKTYSQVLNELHALVDFSKINRNSMLIYEYGGTTSMFQIRDYASNRVSFTNLRPYTGGVYGDIYDIKAASEFARTSGTTYTDNSSATSSSGEVITIYY